MRERAAAASLRDGSGLSGRPRRAAGAGLGHCAEVTQTEPGIKGDTVSNTTKPAVIDTGATVPVPLFIERGERIRVDTRTGAYVGRA